MRALHWRGSWERRQWKPAGDFDRWRETVGEDGGGFQYRWSSSRICLCREKTVGRGYLNRAASPVPTTVMDRTSESLVLDCSSVQDAATSLGGLLGISNGDLLGALKGFEIDWHHPSVAPEDQVVRHLGYEDAHGLPRPAAIRWFHATRAPVGTAFEDGLLPTLAVLPKLMDFLGAVAAKWISPVEWAKYQRSFACSDRAFAQQFRQKRIAPEWQGPFAFLIKDAALHTHNVHKDFTRICETLDDVCADFQQVFGYPLREAYEAATRPCLVVFTRPGDWHGAVKAALNYVHRSVAGLEQSRECNTNFNGNCVAVPPSWIDFVEWS
jgi:hypothetical protein